MENIKLQIFKWFTIFPLLKKNKTTDTEEVIKEEPIRKKRIKKEDINVFEFLETWTPPSNKINSHLRQIIFNKKTKEIRAANTNTFVDKLETSEILIKIDSMNNPIDMPEILYKKYHTLIKNYLNNPAYSSTNQEINDELICLYNTYLKNR